MFCWRRKKVPAADKVHNSPVGADVAPASARDDTPSTVTQQPLDASDKVHADIGIVPPPAGVLTPQNDQGFECGSSDTSDGSSEDDADPFAAINILGPPKWIDDNSAPSQEPSASSET